MSQPNHAPLLRKLALVVVLMFGFAFALVPLYDLFCQVTGINGKTAGQPAAIAASVDNSRLVQVEFLSHTDPAMPWQFTQQTARLQVHPGETKQVFYLAHNPTDRPMVGQAIPSVSPGQAAAYFKKIECFCFQQQTLQGGETRQMGLQFYLDPALPPEIGTITLSYSLYDVTDDQSTTPAQVQ